MLAGNLHITFIPANRRFAPERSHGWVKALYRRDTLDTLWSCAFTILLCIWHVQCLHVPASDDSFWVVARRKVKRAIVAIFGPEILVGFVFGQWTSARRNVEALTKLGYGDWTMTHAFFVDVGGFALGTLSGEKCSTTGRHLYFLVDNGFIDMSKTTKKDIADKDKAGYWAKALTCLQVS